MALKRAQLKALNRATLKVVAGGPTTKTRALGMINLLDQYADAAQLQEDLGANVPVLDPLRTDYPFPFTVKQTIGGQVYFFGTRAAGGPFPAPTSAAGTVDWQPEAAPLPGPPATLFSDSYKAGVAGLQPVINKAGALKFFNVTVNGEEQILGAHYTDDGAGNLTILAAAGVDVGEWVQFCYVTGTLEVAPPVAFADLLGNPRDNALLAQALDAAAAPYTDEDARGALFPYLGPQFRKEVRLSSGGTLSPEIELPQFINLVTSGAGPFGYAFYLPTAGPEGKLYVIHLSEAAPASGTVVLGGGTVDGQTSFVLAPGEWRQIVAYPGAGLAYVTQLRGGVPAGVSVRDLGINGSSLTVLRTDGTSFALALPSNGGGTGDPNADDFTGFAYDEATGKFTATTADETYTAFLKNIPAALLATTLRTQLAQLAAATPANASSNNQLLTQSSLYDLQDEDVALGRRLLNYNPETKVRITNDEVAAYSPHQNTFVVTAATTNVTTAGATPTLQLFGQVGVAPGDRVAVRLLAGIRDVTLTCAGVGFNGPASGATQTLVIRAGEFHEFILVAPNWGDGTASNTVSLAGAYWKTTASNTGVVGGRLRGPYALNTYYARYDRVTQGGAEYAALNDFFSGSGAFDASKWSVVATTGGGNGGGTAAKLDIKIATSLDQQDAIPQNTGYTVPFSFALKNTNGSAATVDFSAHAIVVPRDTRGLVTLAVTVKNMAAGPFYQVGVTVIGADGNRRGLTQDNLIGGDTGGGNLLGLLTATAKETFKAGDSIIAEFYFTGPGNLRGQYQYCTLSFIED